MTAFAIEEIERPLRLGELLTASARIYSNRGWAFVVLGFLQAGTIVAAEYLNAVGAIGVAALAFALELAVVTRLVSGDAFEAALARAARLWPVLVVLALVVGVPFYVGAGLWGFVLLVFSALWLGLTGFAIPAALVEQPPDTSFAGRVAHSLRRTTTLARVEYWHAVGVVAALLAIYVLLDIVLAVAIRGASGLGQTWALAVAQVPLAPFFFIGLSVLYFDQRARSAEPAGPPRPGAR